MFEQLISRHGMANLSMRNDFSVDSRVPRTAASLP